jgi:ATP-dependent RNA helicase RhlE
MEFKELALDPRALAFLEKESITIPTPIQEKAVPTILEGHDVIGVAQTGTGKTLAYGLPALTRIAQHDEPPTNAMLVLTPTRELTVQVNEVMRDLGKYLKLKSVAVYGGVSIKRQQDSLRSGRHIIVATPGRLLDHLNRGNVRFDDLEVLVLDEADRMLDMGFLPDIRRIMRALPSKRQTLMFSATFQPEIQRLVKDFMHEPKEIKVGSVHKPVERVRQLLYPVKPEDKYRLLFSILEEEHIHSAVLFLRTRQRAEQLMQMLCQKGYRATAIHSDRSQGQRQEALEGFREGKYQFLVATDIAARGLDIDHISHVINFDIPPNADDYIHRIGRTARAEAEGDAFTFVSPAEFMPLEAIERELGRPIPQKKWDGAPPILSFMQPVRELPRLRGRVRPGRGLRGRR